jgi:hypothetical protein
MDGTSFPHGLSLGEKGKSSMRNANYSTIFRRASDKWRMRFFLKLDKAPEQRVRSCVCAFPVRQTAEFSLCVGWDNGPGHYLFSDSVAGDVFLQKLFDQLRV